MRIPLLFGLGLNPTIPSPRRCRRSATRLGPSDIDALPRKWLARLPASVRRGRSGRGRRHDLSILQEEFSLTQMLETPISGRIFLEQVIRDNLDIGRPDQVGLVFAPRPIRRCPRATPGQFPDQGDHRRGHPEPARGRQTPRSSSKGRPRAPRPPSPTPTISGSGNHGRICPRCGRSATPPTGACSASNESATTRSPGPAALHTVTASVTTATGTRSHALLTALPLFRAQPNGVANKDLRPLIAELRAAPPDTVTYDL